MFVIMMALDADVKNQMQLLYQRHYQVMLRYACSIVKSQSLAEDIVHSVFIKISAHIYKIEDVDSQSTKRYLLTSTRNMCFDMLKAPIDEELDNDLSEDNTDPVWDQVHIREVIDDISSQIEEMRDIDKGILIYRFKWQYSCREIAEIYNTTENYVTTRISRLREAIKKGLRPKWGDINEFI